MITMVNLIATFDSYGDRRYYFEVDGEIVSECNVVQDNYICNLCTYPQFRNQGYARQMLATIFSLFAGQRMWLRAYTNNAPAIKAYTAVGFTTFEIEDRHSSFYDISCQIASMEVTVPKSEIKTHITYGVVYEEEEYSFENENDRNEFALSLWQDHCYVLWNRTINWYDYDEGDYEWELERAEEDANDLIATHEIISVEG